MSDQPNDNRPGDDRPPGGEPMPPPPPPPDAGAGGWGTGAQQAPPPPGYGAPGTPQYSGYAPAQPMSPHGRPLAEWWKRLVALFIDGLIIGIPAAIVFSVLFGSAFSQAEIDPVTGQVTSGLGGIFAAYGLSVLLYNAAFLIYFGIMNGSESGQTLGKKVMKIQVRDEATGGPIGVGKGMLRYATYFVLSLLCGIGGLLDGLWPLWDQKRQALHDKTVSSIVVDAV